MSAVSIIPAIVLMLLGGVILDRIGLKWVLALSSFVAMVGGVLTPFALRQQNYAMMLVAKLLFGYAGCPVVEI